MKNVFGKLSLMLALSFCLSFPASAQQQSREAALTNAAVIKLVRAGFKEKTIIAIIRSRPAQFDLAPDRLIELKRSNVSENIILAMLSIDDAEFAAGDDWSSDPFFNDPARSKRGNQASDGSTDIFGMNGGSNSRTQQRTGSGSLGGDTQTTGSATVRILRPPLEAGGKPQLEKTPTLTNDSIVELVEAGFSEGTIIRRIENAPAEFDLSAAKLAELRRRRVSDRIIAAMTAAMGDESTSGLKPSTNTPEN